MLYSRVVMRINFHFHIPLSSLSFRWAIHCQKFCSDDEQKLLLRRKPSKLNSVIQIIFDYEVNQGQRNSTKKRNYYLKTKINKCTFYTFLSEMAQNLGLMKTPSTPFPIFQGIGGHPIRKTKSVWLRSFYVDWIATNLQTLLYTFSFLNS